MVGVVLCFCAELAGVQMGAHDVLSVLLVGSSTMYKTERC